MMEKNVPSGLGEFKRKVDEEISLRMRKYRIPGVTISVIADGGVVLNEQYGWANYHTRQPLHEKTRFQVGSLSKPVTAWGIMKLVEQGIVSLDDPVEKYLTRWKLPRSKFNHEEVTIRRVLSHTAGLSVRGYLGIPPHKKQPSLEQSLSGTGFLKRPVRVKQPPGAGFLYSGGGYTLLQLLIEEVSGYRFSDFMTEEVLIPLGMRNSSFKWTKEMKQEVSVAYDYFQRPLPNYLYIEEAAAGLYSTGTDLANFMLAHFNGGGHRVLNEESIHLIQTQVDEAIPYGLGYRVVKLENQLKMVMHDGINRGWRSRMVFFPEKQSGIVILTNADNGDQLIADLSMWWIESSVAPLSELGLVITRPNHFYALLTSLFS